MRKSLKRQALEHIVKYMEMIASDCEENISFDIKEETEAMKNLAHAYTLVKRGVMLPDAWEKLEKRVGGE